MTVDEPRTHGNSRDHERRHRQRVARNLVQADHEGGKPHGNERDAQPVDGQLLTRHNIDDRATRNEKEDECRHCGNGEQHPQPPIGNDKARNDGSHRKPYSDNTAIDGKQTTSPIFR